MSLGVKKAVPYIVLPNTIGAIIVVSDSLYDTIPNRKTEDDSYVMKSQYGFVVENWEKSRVVTKN